MWRSIAATLTVLLFPLTGAVGGNYSLRTLFGEMPDSLLPTLSEYNRLDMIDFMVSGMEAEVSNNLDGTSVMTQLTDSFLSIRMSDAVEVEMRLLNYEGVHKASELKADSALSLAFESGLVICVVTTYGEEAAESRVEFFNVGWQKMSNIADPLSGVDKRGFIEQADSVGDFMFADLEAQVDQIMVVGRLSAEEASLTLVPFFPLSNMEQKEAIRQCQRLRKLKWTGTQFKND